MGIRTLYMSDKDRATYDKFQGQMGYKNWSQFVRDALDFFIENYVEGSRKGIIEHSVETSVNKALESQTTLLKKFLPNAEKIDNLDNRLQFLLETLEKTYLSELFLSTKSQGFVLLELCEALNINTDELHHKINEYRTTLVKKLNDKKDKITSEFSEL